MKINVIGTGYVGLVSGACLADVGMNVHCIDIDERKIEQLNHGVVPIYEPGLETIVKRNVQNERLHFSTNLEKTLPDSDAVFIAVGTPPDENGKADLQYVKKVAEQIGQSINNYIVVVTKSTVPVGTSHLIKNIIQQELDKRGSNLTFDVASNPEFLKEGAAIKDFMSPDRVIIGVESERAQKVLEQIYKPFQLNGYRIIYMDITSSELTKYAANAMLATRISFMNDIANLCEIVGANINNVRQGIGSDPRIGSKFLYPGVGYGGSCFPKDVKALIQTGKENGHNFRILQAVEDVNNDQKKILSTKLYQHFDQNIQGKIIGVWGLSFKPNTDDMREASSLIVIQELLNRGAIVKVYDPIAMNEAKHHLGNNVTWAANSYEAINQTDALLLITEWNEFRSPDWKKVKALMNKPVIFDGRNIYDKEMLTQKGFTYFGIGV